MPEARDAPANRANVGRASPPAIRQLEVGGIRKLRDAGQTPFPGAVEQDVAVPDDQNPVDQALFRRRTLKIRDLLRGTCLCTRAESENRAERAHGGGLRADKRSQLHHGLVVQAGGLGIEKRIRNRLMQLRGCRARAQSATVVREAGDDPDDISIDASVGAAEGDAGNGGRCVGTDPFKLTPACCGARQLVPEGRDVLRKRMQATCTGVVAEPFPVFQNRAFLGRGKALQVRETLHPTGEVGQNRLDLGLLQHELRHDGRIKGRVHPPGKRPSLAREPSVQRDPEFPGGIDQRGCPGWIRAGLGFVLSGRASGHALFRLKKRSEEAPEDAARKPALHTVKLDAAQAARLRAWCEGRGWAPFEVPYTDFAFKGPTVNLQYFSSGKLVIAGKGTQDFIIDVLEPEITREAKFGYDEVHHPDWFEAHAGMDESGKGDLFGPVISACVVADGDAVRKWMKAGVRDSKTISESGILKLEEMIRSTNGVVVETAFCGMERYNELMARPRANLNKLLAWLHAKSLDAAIARRRVPWGLLDQFTTERLVETYSKTEGFELRMRTKAEEDPVVAAASIVARGEFVRQMDKLSKEAGEKLLRGAGAGVKAQARKIVERLGARSLPRFAKLHFRTAYEVVSELGKLDELPLKPPGPKFQWKGGRG